MALIDKPISQRAGYTEGTATDALQRELGAMAVKHGLVGCVLVEFGEKVGVRSWGQNDGIAKAMDTLGVRILTDIDDGRHDPLEHIEAEGKA